MKDKLKSKGFWIAAAGAAIMLLQVLGVKINVPYVSEIVNAVCALMIVLGLMTDDTKKQSSENPDNTEGTDAQIETDIGKEAGGHTEKGSDEARGGAQTDGGEPGTAGLTAEDEPDSGSEAHALAVEKNGAEPESAERDFLEAGAASKAAEIAAPESGAGAGTTAVRKSSAKATAADKASASAGKPAAKAQPAKNGKTKITGFLVVDEPTQEEIRNTIDVITARKKKR